VASRTDTFRSGHNLAVSAPTPLISCLPSPAFEDAPLCLVSQQTAGLAVHCSSARIGRGRESLSVSTGLAAERQLKLPGPGLDWPGGLSECGNCLLRGSGVMFEAGWFLNWSRSTQLQST
jgi:hypothetical protein